MLQLGRLQREPVALLRMQRALHAHELTHEHRRTLRKHTTLIVQPVIAIRAPLQLAHATRREACQLGAQHDALAYQRGVARRYERFVGGRVGKNVELLG